MEDLLFPGDSFLSDGGFFKLALPNFSTKKKIANQPIPAAVSVNPVNKKGPDWLLGNFLFGTEKVLKKTPCIFS